MFYEEISPEEEDKIITEIAKKIIDIGMEEVAPLFLGLSYPFAYVGGQMSRIFLGPYTVILGKHEGSFNKYVSIFEKRQNIRKLINRINELAEEKREKDRRKKEMKKNAPF